MPKFHAATQATVGTELMHQGLPKLRGVEVGIVENKCFLGLAPTSKTREDAAGTSNSSMGLDGQTEAPCPVSAIPRYL